MDSVSCTDPSQTQGQKCPVWDETSGECLAAWFPFPWLLAISWTEHQKRGALAADPPIQEGLAGEMVAVQLVGQCTASIHSSDKREVLDVCVVGGVPEFG